MGGHAKREKRNYIRIVYNPGKRPRLTAYNAEFEVSDFSEAGILTAEKNLFPINSYL